jgi:hypothetical protein
MEQERHFRGRLHAAVNYGGLPLLHSKQDTLCSLSKAILIKTCGMQTIDLRIKLAAVPV